MWQQRVSSLAIWIVLYHMSDAHITVKKNCSGASLNKTFPSFRHSKFSYRVRCHDYYNSYVRLTVVALWDWLCIERKNKMFLLTTQSTHFIYGHMAKDHFDGERGNWLPPLLGLGYSFQLATRNLLYTPSHKQDSTYHHHLLHQSWRTGCNTK